jgi:hypothetical protein
VPNGVLLLTDGSGNFPTAANFATGFQPTIVWAGDLNGDRKADLIWRNTSSGGVAHEQPDHYLGGLSEGAHGLGNSVSDRDRKRRVT